MNTSMHAQNKYLSWIFVPLFFPSLLAIAVTSCFLPQPAPARAPERNYRKIRIFLSGRIKQIMADVWQGQAPENKLRDRRPDEMIHENDPFQSVTDDSLPFNIRRFHMN